MLLSLIITLAILTGQLIKLPFGEGGISLLDIDVIIFCLFGLIQLKFNLKKPPQFILAALVFILVAIISLIFTSLHLQLNEYLVSFSYLVRFAFYILFAWLIYSGAFNDFQEQITNTLIYSGLGLSVLGLLQFMLFPNLQFLQSSGWDPHYYRTVSTFFDPNFAGAYFALTLILILSLRKPYLLFIPLFLALLTTFSRSSYLMFLISGLSFSFLQKSKKLMIQVIVLFIILLLGFQIYTKLVSKPRNIDRTQSASFRLSTWQQGIQLFQDHPILGVGFNAYRYALREYKLGDAEFLKSHGATSNDSSMLFVASTTGFIGFICYLIFIISLLKKGIKDNYVLSASVLGLLIHSIFANSLFFPPIFLWLMLTSQTPKK